MDGLHQIYINAVSMITPVGANTLMTSAAIKAGRNGYCESSILGTRFTPLKIAPVPVNDEALWSPDIPDGKPLYKQRRTRRMLGLAAAALAEILPLCPDFPLPLFLAGPESIPSVAIDGLFLSLLSKAAPAHIDAQSSRLIATGRPGGLQAIELAFRYLSQTKASHVLVGGVDSLIDLLTLGVLSNEDRISSLGVGNGFTPGEGAAFLLLSTEKSSESLAAVRQPAITAESGHRYSKEPYRGEGLASAFQQVLNNYDGPPVDTIFSGMNGESFGAKEHGVAMIRNQQHFSPSLKLEHPADCFGDLGAAVGPILIGLAANNLRSKRTQSSAIVCCSADRETRSACAMTTII